MSPMTARAVTTALLGGAAMVLFSIMNLLGWAGLLAWGGFLAAGGDTTALKKTIAGSIVGAFLAWIVLMIAHQVQVPAHSWLWMPRFGLAVAVTLLVLCLAAKVEWLSHLPAGLAGYAAVLVARAVAVEDASGLMRLTGLHLYNPFIQVSISMAAGALVGLVAVKLAGALSKK